MGKIRKRKKWIAKPTEFSEALHRNQYQKQQEYHVRAFQSTKQAREYQAIRQCIS